MIKKDIKTIRREVEELAKSLLPNAHVSAEGGQGSFIQVSVSGVSGSKHATFSLSDVDKDPHLTEKVETLCNNIDKFIGKG